MKPIPVLLIFSSLCSLNSSFLPSVPAATIYVKPTGNDANTGLSWDQARQTVAAGLAAAASGDEVWVAAGTYYERVTLVSAVALYGGFGGTEANLSQRNFHANPTILDGQMAGSVVTSPPGATLTTRIDGFTIRNGTGTFLGNSSYYGGGIFCGSSSPTISNNTICANSLSEGWSGSGGGIYCANSAAVIVNNVIGGNSVSRSIYGYGGGILCSYSSPTISNNLITGNTASGDPSGYGGGIFCFRSSPSITNNTIMGNTALGYLPGYGGAIYFYALSSPVIANNIIAFNDTGICKGSNDGTPSLRNNCVFNPAFNYAGLSAGIMDIQQDPLVADSAAGDCRLTPSSPCIDTGNSADVQPNSVDMDGQPRIYGSRVDIGADEWYPAPTVTGIAPSCALNTGSVDIVNLTGTNFQPGATVKLRRVDQPDISATQVNVMSAGQITCTLNLSGAVPGIWDVVVTNPDNASGTLLNEFTVVRAVIYVSPAGNDANPGTSWSQAKHSVTAGLDAAMAGDQVWVAAGTYNERITLKLDVALYGGFIGTEAELSQRDFRANPTILDGQAAGAVISSPIGATPTTQVDGLTIRNGTVGQQGDGAILCLRSSPTISNNVITGNNVVRGGGIFCMESAPTIRNNVISANSASDYGGGIYCYASSPIIVNNTISANGASVGGGIYCTSFSYPTIRNNTLSGNSAFWAGGIYCEFSSPTIANNIIAFNATGICRDPGSSDMPILRNNCVFNPGGDNYSDLSPGPEDINLDPQMETPEYGKYHLKPNSPCINVGSDADVQSGQVDMDGRTRVIGSHVDIGADEYDGTAYAYTPSIICVSSAGNDDHNGSGWAQAKRTIQAGIDAAATAGGEVWVAEGIYNERISLKAFTYLYGGFAGTETRRNQRNFIIHTTVLDGQQGGSVVTFGPCGYHLSRIDGVTVRNGSGTVIDNYPDNLRCGGGIFCRSSSPIISNNTITENNASLYGGGILCYSSSPIISNNTIRRNAASNGGGICGFFHSGPIICSNVISENIAGNDGCGGGICSESSYLIVSNNTICRNSAGNGGGICARGGGLTVSSNIIAFNSSGVDWRSSYEPVLQSNCIYNPDGDNYTYLSPGPTDFALDPLFVGRLNSDYHLTAASPCLDAGTNADVDPAWLDIDAQPRIAGPRVDIGADEYYLPGDANGNGAVGFEDFAALQNHYAQSAQTWANGDFNADAQVTFEDFSILQNSYGQCVSTAESSESAVAESQAAGIPCATLAAVLLLVMSGASLCLWTWE